MELKEIFMGYSPQPIITYTLIHTTYSLVSSQVLSLVASLTAKIVWILLHPVLFPFQVVGDAELFSFPDFGREFIFN